MNPELGELIEGATSIMGFGFDSQTGFDSLTAVATASSSGEHEISLGSLAIMALGRVWVNAEVDQSARAKQATITRGNSFRSSINREVPSLS
jgi:hypothetical protein